MLKPARQYTTYNEKNDMSHPDFSDKYDPLEWEKSELFQIRSREVFESDQPYSMPPQSILPREYLDKKSRAQKNAHEAQKRYIKDGELDFFSWVDSPECITLDEILQEETLRMIAWYENKKVHKSIEQIVTNINLPDEVLQESYNTFTSQETDCNQDIDYSKPLVLHGILAPHNITVTTSTPYIENQFTQLKKQKESSLIPPIGWIHNTGDNDTYFVKNDYIHIENWLDYSQEVQMGSQKGNIALRIMTNNRKEDPSYELFVYRPRWIYHNNQLETIYETVRIRKSPVYNDPSDFWPIFEKNQDNGKYPQKSSDISQSNHQCNTCLIDYEI